MIRLSYKPAGAVLASFAWILCGLVCAPLSVVLSAQAQDDEEVAVIPVEISAESALGVTVRTSVQRRVNYELIAVCGDYRCEGFRRSVRTIVTPTDTLDSAGVRLAQAMLQKVDEAFQTQPSPERVIVDGYLYQGPNIATTEFPPITLFVPRHRWVVGRYGIEQDSILYTQLLSEIQDTLSPFLPADAAPSGSGSLPPLPPLPNVNAPSPAQRQPITP